ncbi:conserved hypothetical protein [Prochlorococcus marinus str. MIT 9202]|nr:conserved hypothetical protein [Prochlorococcus marinus str. MIT 9202]
MRIFDITFKIKKNYLFSLSRKITILISFNIETKFEEWIKIFDSKESDLIHSEFDIKALFRGLSKDDPKKVICINQSPEGNIQKLFKANSKCIKIHKINFSYMEESSWI